MARPGNKSLFSSFDQRAKITHLEWSGAMCPCLANMGRTGTPWQVHQLSIDVCPLGSTGRKSKSTHQKVRQSTALFTEVPPPPNKKELLLCHSGFLHAFSGTWLSGIFCSYLLTSQISSLSGWNNIL